MTKRSPWQSMVKLIKDKLDGKVDGSININRLCNCELPDVPGHVIDDITLVTMSEHNLWGTLSSIKLLEDRLTNIDLENRRKLRDELCQRHPELICPVCKKLVTTNIQQPIVPVLEALNDDL